MRPVKLKLSAFGPYADETLVELDKLGENGIYLITGDTGAGKTTIFDGIAYALYGEPSGKDREVSMFRSKYADGDVATFVELTFLVDGQEYFIRRNPEYERPSKKGDKTTRQKAEAYIRCPDGSEYTRLKDVDTVVRDILGVDRNQFSQIAMIAQGDFMKLLLADTKDRQKIFRELFHTERYQLLQDRIKSEALELGKKYEDGKASIRQYIGGIICDESDEFFASVTKAVRGEMLTSDVITLLEDFVERDNGLLQEIHAALSANEKETEKVSVHLTKAEALRKKEAELEKSEKEFLEAFPLVLQCEAREKELAAKNDEKEDKNRQITEIRAQFGDYDNLGKIRDSLVFLAQAVIRDKALKEKDENRVINCANELKQLKDELVSLADAGTQKEKLVREKEAAEDRKKRAEELKRRLADFEKLCKELEKAQQVYINARETAEKSSHEYARLNKAFLDSQAGILADGLEEGVPCPVCGSCSHPLKAQRLLEAPTENQLKLMKQMADADSEAVREAGGRAGELNGRVAAQKNAVSEDAAQFFGDEAISSVKEKMDGLLSLAETEIREINSRINKENSRIVRKNTLEKLVPEKEQEQERFKENLSETEKKIAAAQAKYAELEKQAAELSSKLGFADKALAQEFVDKLTEEVRVYTLKLEKAVADRRAAENRLVELKGRIAQLKKDVAEAEKDDCDFEKLSTEKASLVAEKNELMTRLKKTTVRIETNTRMKESIEIKSQDISLTEEKWKWVKALSDTANGGLLSQGKFMFETYIQAVFFDRIIRRANVRLRVMSDGQYELRRCETALNNRSQSGLELDVVDHYNGSVRNVKTLSGGESFMASLSLALGLSDATQSEAGGIRLDTMFVDEGFGSLDDRALSQAIRALASLSDGNRLVGIISHVAELKEKIDKQIVVTKEKSGGSKVSIIS